jgi:hypothetical protein
MGMYHNVRATSDGAGGDASGGLKHLLEQAAADSDPAGFLLEDRSVDYLATEIGLRIFSVHDAGRNRHGHLDERERHWNGLVDGDRTAEVVEAELRS